MRWITTAIACWTITIGLAWGADSLRVLPPQLDGVATDQMMHAWLMRHVEEATDRRDREFEKLVTPDEIAAYQQRMRQFFVDQLGGLPERTPLSAKVTGKQQRDGYRIEKILFESRPRHYVTAILYLPEAKPPYPGVLVPCGHSSNGKARDLYQRAPILLAKCGMAALCYDPIDQGERHQLLDADGTPLVTSSTMGHNLAGVGAVLLGLNTASYRVWDGMRAIDYLASRPEVDSNRIGCTGISGGGTLTSYLMALDDRILAAAPGCYLTSYRRLLETVGPQDAEQTIFGQIGHGMDHADYLLMRAPRPTLMMTATNDYFDIDGAWHSFREAKRCYGRLGFAERVDMLETDGKHGFPQPMREAAARWMRRWLMKIDDAVTEPEFEVAKDEDLWCTPHGEVMLLDGARSVFDLNVETEERLAAGRKKFWQNTPRAEALAAVRRVTGIRRLVEIPEPKWQKTGTVERDGYRIDKIAIEPEPGVWLAALVFVPNKPSGESTMLVDTDGKQSVAAPGGVAESLVKTGQLIMAVDLRGQGETAAGGTHSYARYLPPEWRDATIAYLLGKSYLAMRTEDILVCGRLLAGYENAGPLRKVHLQATGRAGPPALHAAALEPAQFASLALRNSLVSWANVVRTPMSKNQHANLVHGALRVYDLPALLATLPADRVTIIEPFNAAEEPIDVQEPSS